jgi:hypothetical protein
MRKTQRKILEKNHKRVESLYAIEISLDLQKL